MNRNKKLKGPWNFRWNGPYATVFFKRIQNTPIKKDIDHFRVLVITKLKSQVEHEQFYLTKKVCS